MGISSLLVLLFIAALIYYLVFQRNKSNGDEDSSIKKLKVRQINTEEVYAEEDYAGDTNEEDDDNDDNDENNDEEDVFTDENK